MTRDPEIWSLVAAITRGLAASRVLQVRNCNERRAAPKPPEFNVHSSTSSVTSESSHLQPPKRDYGGYLSETCLPLIPAWRCSGSNRNPGLSFSS
jgi:hypothetical protein